MSRKAKNSLTILLLFVIGLFDKYYGRIILMCLLVDNIF